MLNANQKVDNYWIRYRGFGTCNTRNLTTRVHQVSILRYESAELTDPKAPVGYDIPETPADARVRHTVPTKVFAFANVLLVDFKST